MKHFATLHNWRRFQGEKMELQFELHVPSWVEWTGEMSNQLWKDLINIYNVAKRLGM
jgi:hypothetical protein